ncbi:MAG: response regulator [Bacteroidota bacterium]
MKKIVLIEDNLEVRENIAEILELAGYEVMTAANGKDGVRQVRQDQPDMIICDIMMPELDGYGVLRMLSRDPSTARIPFIFLTAKAEKEDFRKGMNMGADDYITKPFTEAELLDAIDIRLRKHAELAVDVSEQPENLKQFLNEAKGRAAMEALSEDREERLFSAGNVLFQEGSYPNALMYILRGKVKGFKTNEDGKELITDLYRAGDFLCHHALLSDAPLGECALALEETNVILIPKNDFFALVYNNRDVSHHFIRLLSRDVGEKEEQLLHLAYDTVRKRVADALLHLRERYQEEGEKSFSMAITRDNLANLVGTSKECVIRVLSEFKADGIVRTRQSEIEILVPEELAKIRF